MVKKLFLLDGMALVYRAHFALIRRPILTSKGVNTSALYGFTQTLLDILKNQQPTHLARRVRHRRADAAAHRVRRLQGQAAGDARGPQRRAAPCAAHGRGVPYPGAHLRRLRGRRHHRHAGAARRTGGLPVLHGHAGQGLRPAGQREHLHLQARRGWATTWRSSACRRFRHAGACSARSRWWMCWR